MIQFRGISVQFRGEVGVGQLYHLITVIVQRDKLRLFADFQAAATVDAIGGTVNSVTR